MSRRRPVALRAASARGVTLDPGGETGTGKELVAEAVHRANRTHRAFVSVNAAAVASSTAPSQLFG